MSIWYVNFWRILFISEFHLSFYLCECEIRLKTISGIMNGYIKQINFIFNKHVAPLWPYPLGIHHLWHIKNIGGLRQEFLKNEIWILQNKNKFLQTNNKMWFQVIVRHSIAKTIKIGRKTSKTWLLVHMSKASNSKRPPRNAVLGIVVVFTLN